MRDKLRKSRKECCQLRSELNSVKDDESTINRSVGDDTIQLKRNDNDHSITSKSYPFTPLTVSPSQYSSGKNRRKDINNTPFGGVVRFNDRDNSEGIRDSMNYREKGKFKFVSTQGYELIDNEVNPCDVLINDDGVSVGIDENRSDVAVVAEGEVDVTLGSNTSSLGPLYGEGSKSLNKDFLNKTLNIIPSSDDTKKLIANTDIHKNSTIKGKIMRSNPIPSPIRIPTFMTTKNSDFDVYESDNLPLNTTHLINEVVASVDKKFTFHDSQLMAHNQHISHSPGTSSTSMVTSDGNVEDTKEGADVTFLRLKLKLIAKQAKSQFDEVIIVCMTRLT